MLILTRKNDEAIRIGDDIVIKIVEISKKHVKIGIEAPKHVTINREEIYERIQEENREAATTQLDSAKNMANLLKKESSSAKDGVNFGNLFKKRKD